MRNGTLKYPQNRFAKRLPKRMSGSPAIRLFDDLVKYGFNDFMAQCRHSPLVRCNASPQNRTRNDPPARVITKTGGAIVKSARKQKI